MSEVTDSGCRKPVDSDLSMEVEPCVGESNFTIS